MSTVVVVGNLTADPELRFTNTSLPVVNFSIAENKKKGEEKITFYYDVTAWGTLAENICESVFQGDRIIVVGELQQDKWEADDGSNRSKVGIKAYQIGPDLNWATCEVVKNEREQ